MSFSLHQTLVHTKTHILNHTYIKHQLPFVDQTNKYFAHEDYLMCGLMVQIKRKIPYGTSMEWKCLCVLV